MDNESKQSTTELNLTYDAAKKCSISIMGSNGKYMCHADNMIDIECTGNGCKSNDNFVSIPVPIDVNMIAIKSPRFRYLGSVPDGTKVYTVGWIKDWEIFKVVYNKNRTVSFQSVAHKKYLSLHKNGQIMCDKDKITENEQFIVEVVEILPDKEANGYDASKECMIGICAFNENFITAEDNGRVVCDRPWCREWEYFNSLPLENGLVSLTTYHRQYLSSNEYGKIKAADSCKKWETFNVTEREKGLFTFQCTANEKYLSAHANTGSLKCDAGVASAKTEFKIKMIEEESKEYDASKECVIGIRGFNEYFITAEDDGSVVCDRKHCQGWEHFTSVPLENGLIALKTYHDNFVSVGRKGDNLISNTVKKIENTEQFKVISNKNGTFCFVAISNGKYLYSGYDLFTFLQNSSLFFVLSNRESLSCDGDKITENQRFKIKMLNDDHWIKEFEKGIKGSTPSQNVKQSGYNENEIDVFLKYANENIAEFKTTKTLKMNRFKSGASCAPYLIDANNKKYVLKMPNSIHMKGEFHGWAMSKINCNLEFRFELMDLLNKTTKLPIPRMIHCCNDGKLFGKPFVLMEYVEGKMYDMRKQSAKRKEKMKSALYKCVADMHSIDIYKSGIVELFKKYKYEFEKEKRNSINTLNHFDKQRFVGQSMRTDAYYKFRDALFEYYEEHKEINEIESKLKYCLLHNDIHGGNILWNIKDDEVRIAALLDWEYPDIGIPLFDLSWMNFCGCVGDGQEIIEKYVKNDALLFGDEDKRDCVWLIESHWNFYCALTDYRMGIYDENRLVSGMKKLKNNQKNAIR